MKKLLFALVLLVSIPVDATNAPFLAWYARDAQGKALVGSTLNFYTTGGMVARNVYSDEARTASLGSTLTADGAGRFPRFYMDTGNYKIIHKTRAGVILWTEQNIYSLKTDLSGILSGASASATAAVTGTNTANGYGVHAITTAGSSHALYVAADPSTPVKSAVHIVPQDTTPSAPTKGDLWFDETTGRPRIYDGTGMRELLTTNRCVVTGENGSAGGTFAGGTGNTNGIYAAGTGSGDGVHAIGGITDGIGVHALGSGNGTGVTAVGAGSGVGISANGFYGCACVGTSVGLYAESDTTSPLSAAIHIVPQDTAPAAPTEGDVYYNSTTHHLYVRLAAAWAQLDP